MKNYKVSLPWLVITSIALWTFVISMVIWANQNGFSDVIAWVTILIGIFAIFCTIMSLTLGYFNLTKRQVENEKRAVSGPLSKILAGLIIAGLLISSYAAINSLWIEPSHSKFAYQNTAVIAGFGSIVLVMLLSAIQKDIYWITRKRAIRFDERQIQSRQQVFETSYKIGAVAVLLFALIVPGYAHNLPAIMSHSSFGYEVPSQLFWPLYDLAILLYALPLIVAAWRKK